MCSASFSCELGGDTIFYVVFILVCILGDVTTKDLPFLCLFVTLNKSEFVLSVCQKSLR